MCRILLAESCSFWLQIVLFSSALLRSIYNNVNEFSATAGPYRSWSIYSAMSGVNNSVIYGVYSRSNVLQSTKKNTETYDAIVMETSHLRRLKPNQLKKM